MKTKVPFEIRLIAFTRDDDGNRQVFDIVETSNRNASYFMRRWMHRFPEVDAVGTSRPGDNRYHVHNLRVR